MYDKLELLTYLCASETPVTLRSLIRTHSTLSKPNINGASYKYEDNRPIGIDIYDYSYYRRGENNKPYTANMDFKIKGLMYQVHFTNYDKNKRYNEKSILYNDEVLIFKIERRMSSTYESLILAELEI